MNSSWPYRRLDQLGAKDRPVLKAGPFGSAVTKEIYIDSGFKVYGQQEVVSGNVNAERYYVSEDVFQELKSCAVRPGDILITMMGTVGKLLIVPPDAEPGIINPRLMRISLDQSVANPAFVAAFLGSAEIQRLLERRAHGGTMPGLNANALGSIKIPLPPLPEQRKIADILRTCDEAIEKLEALRAAKERQLLALTNALVFGKMRLQRFRKNPRTTSHRWFALPSDWKCHLISDVATEISERNHNNERSEVLSCLKSSGFVRSLEYFKKQVFSSDLRGYKKIWRMDFGFPSNHVEEGSIGLQDITEVGLVSPIYTVFRFNPGVVNPLYAFAVLKTEVYRHIFEVSTSASVDRRGSLRWGEFKTIPFPVPSVAEQTAIVDVLKTAKSERDKLLAQLEAVRLQKRGLMQKLLTGKVHMPEAAVSLSPAAD